MKKKNKVFERIELAMVKHIIVVSSGKGGVGKSTVAVNLAVSMAQKGRRTALVDADLYGPSIPLMFNLLYANPDVKSIKGKSMLIPIEKYGIKIMSIGFLMDPRKALIWRGPLVSNALIQLFSDTNWGELDYMIVDLPPGTGDIHITIIQKLNIAGAVIVTTPQNIAISEIKKTADMFLNSAINIKILGIIENMSYFSPPELADNKYYILGKGGGERVAKELGVPLLGQIPIVESVCESGERGIPIAIHNDNSVAKVFHSITAKIIEQIEKK